MVDGMQRVLKRRSKDLPGSFMCMVNVGVQLIPDGRINIRFLLKQEVAVPGGVTVACLGHCQP